MLSFADTPWQIISAIIAFISGLILAHVQKRIFRVPVALSMSMYIWHTFFCIFYMLYSFNNTADATSYYIHSKVYQGFSFTGTDFIYFLTSIFSNTMSMSYGGTFLVYNIFGFIGMVSLSSAFLEVTNGAKRGVIIFLLAALFLPGLSFWSSAIGKDALTFMGAGLACWAVLNLGRRYPAMAFAFLVILVARPHIAGILAASLGLTLVLFLRTGIMAKFFTLALTAPLALGAVIFGLDYAGVGDPTSLESISERIAVQQGHNLEGGSSVSITDMSVPMRLVTYMFRPMLLDASGALGLVASFENLALLSIFLIAVFGALGNTSSLSRFHIFFFLTFSIITWTILANTTANSGIAIRQKWMFVPMMLTLALSVMGRPRISARAAWPIPTNEASRSC